MTAAIRILTLATCFNRKDATILALSDLHAQTFERPVNVQHAIVDDGSNDGTAQAVAEAFPNVTVISGTGSLFWAGGMRFGWHEYARHQDFDYIFVYNDDGRFDLDALNHLVDSALAPEVPATVVGSFKSMDGDETTYGARRHTSTWHPFKFGQIVEPDGTVQKADTLNMNGALISRGALEKVGFLSDYFLHSNADFEYGIKLRRAGGQVLVAPRHIGRCEINPASLVSPTDATNLRAAIKMLLDPKREPIGQRFQMYRMHGGWLWPLLFISPYVTIWLHPLRRWMKRRVKA